MLWLEVLGLLVVLLLGSMGVWLSYCLVFVGAAGKGLLMAALACSYPVSCGFWRFMRFFTESTMSAAEKCRLWPFFWVWC